MPALTREQLLIYVTAGALFALLAALWFGLILVWSMRRGRAERAIGQRLGQFEEAGGKAKVLRLWHEGTVATTVVPGRQRLPLWVRLERLRRDAGLQAEMRTALLGVAALTAAAGVGAAMLAGNAIVGVAVAAVVPIGFRMYLQMRVSKRAAVFEDQFIGALELAARSLRSGHPLLGAFQLVSEELDPPVSTVFAEICQQHDMGVSLESAIQRVATGSRSGELKLFATSVAVQLRSGGNLAEMMERLAAVVRDRARLNRRVRVLTAQTQLSKRILLALPIIIFAVLSLMNPRYMDLFYSTETGLYMLLAAGGMMVVGTLVMNRMAVLRY